MNMLTRWLFRRLAEKRIIGFIWLGDYPAAPGEVLSPRRVEVIFRGR